MATLQVYSLSAPSPNSARSIADDYFPAKRIFSRIQVSGFLCNLGAFARQPTSRKGGKSAKQGKKISSL
jgi:hypothetical protein